MEHWEKNLHEHLREELEDSVHYAEIAREHHGETRQMYHDMAQEEYEHAEAIWYMMKHNGMTAGLDKEAVFRAANEALYK